MRAKCSFSLLVSRFGKLGQRVPNFSSGTISLVRKAVDVPALYMSYINLTKSCHDRSHQRYLGYLLTGKIFWRSLMLILRKERRNKFRRLYELTQCFSHKRSVCEVRFMYINGFPWLQPIYVAGSSGQPPISPSTQLTSDLVHTKNFENCIPLTGRVGRLWTDHSSGNHMGLVSRMSISRKPNKFSISHRALHYEV